MERTLLNDLKIRKVFWRTLSVISALLLAVIISSILIIMVGSDPIVAYKAFFQAIFGEVDGLSEVLVKAIPLTMVGLGMAVAFKAKFWNIGGEGQIIMGAIAAAWIGTTFTSLPGPVLTVLVLVGGFILGMIWGGISGFLKAKFHLNEVIVTVMMNYIATYLQIYLVRGPMINKAMPFWPASAFLPESSWFSQLIEGSRVHSGLWVAIILVAVVWLLMNRMPLGFRIQATGASRESAKYNGIKVGTILVLAVSISGGLAGVAGANEVLGVHHRLLDLIAAGYGFTAIVVAVLGRLNPIGVLIAAIGFGALLVGGNMMQVAAEIPTALIVAFQGIVLVSVLLMEKLFSPLINQKETKAIKS